MNTLSTEELKSLVEERTGPFVSISMPTERAGMDTRQNPIRFRKVLRDAEEKLSNRGFHAHEVLQLIEPARKLLEDTLFWQHQGEGLAVFVSPKQFHHYELPFRPEEVVIVGERFHVKPILQMLTSRVRFNILALSQNKVRFLEATQHGAREVSLKGAPASLADSSKYEQTEKQVQFRTLTGKRPGKGDGIFYGSGSTTDLTKERIAHYLHQVNDSLCKQVRDTRTPLVFAGVDYLFAMYKEVNGYPRLVEEPILGNPDEIGVDELFRRAWPIVQPIFAQELSDASNYYRQLANTPRASHLVSQVAPAAYHGRVEVLFVQMGVQAWGSFAPEVSAVHEYDQPHPGSEDLLDFAAVHTLLNGGTVYALDPEHMPNGSSIAAVFRY